MKHIDLFFVLVGYRFLDSNILNLLFCTLFPCFELYNDLFRQISIIINYNLHLCLLKISGKIPLKYILN